MRLLDVRKLAIKQRLRVRFQLANGMECMIDEHGLTRVPELQSAPGFNLEDEFASSVQFDLERIPAPGTKQKGTKHEAMTREQLESLLGAPAAGKPADDHED